MFLWTLYKKWFRKKRRLTYSAWTLQISSMLFQTFVKVNNNDDDEWWTKTENRTGTRGLRFCPSLNWMHLCYSHRSPTPLLSIKTVAMPITSVTMKSWRSVETPNWTETIALGRTRLTDVGYSLSSLYVVVRFRQSQDGAIETLITSSESDVKRQ